MVIGKSLLFFLAAGLCEIGGGYLERTAQGLSLERSES